MSGRDSAGSWPGGRQLVPGSRYLKGQIGCGAARGAVGVAGNRFTVSRKVGSARTSARFEFSENW